MPKSIIPVGKKKKKEEQLPARITNDTVAQHREKVLSGGRKLKYPLQYTKRALVRNAIIVSLAGVMVLSILVWLQLYVWKDAGNWAYQVTRVIPLPVAKIDGEYVRYSDYLLYHRSTVAVLEGQGRAGDSLSSDRLQFQQQQAMDRALEDAYAKKIARKNNIPLASDKKVKEHIEQNRKESGLTEGAYATALSDQLRWTMDELRTAMRYTILRQDAAFSVDSTARGASKEVAQLLSKGKVLSEIAESLGDKVDYQADIVVPKGNSDGLAVVAAGLEIGSISPSTKTLAGDGYYFIARHASEPDAVSYSYIKVPLTVFKKDFEALKKSGATEVFIKLK